MPEQFPTSPTCDRCGGLHATERHPSAKIVVTIADTPRAATGMDLDVVDERASEGWDTIAALAKRSHRARESMETLIAPQRLLHPEWFIVRRKRSSGHIAEHVHPDLVALVERQLQEPPPDGWFPATSFGRRITAIASVTARVHPDLVRPYVAPDGPARGQLILYYAPEFLTALAAWLGEQEQRSFPIGTTPANLESAFGLSMYAAPFSAPAPGEARRTSGEARVAPYRTVEEIVAARDAIIASIREDIVEDADRVRRARTARMSFTRKLEESRRVEEEER